MGVQANQVLANSKGVAVGIRCGRVAGKVGTQMLKHITNSVKRQQQEVCKALPCDGI
jgi:hypothetical protein